MKKIVAVINTKASRATFTESELKTFFKSSGIKLQDLILIQKPEQLPKVLGRVFKQKPTVVVVGGGDGTIMSFADAAKKASYSGQLAILPVGTANYLARNLGIPLDIKEAISLIKKGRPKTISLPRANTMLFSLLVSVGVVAAASGSVSVRFKRRAGQFAYVVESLKQLIRHESFTYHIKTGSGKEIKGRSHQIILINADMSHQLELIPGNELTKPTMTLTVFNTRTSKLKLVLSVVLYILSFGRIKRGLQVIDDTEFEIKTSPANEVSVDGEINFKTPVRVTADDSRITVLCPQDVVG